MKAIITAICLFSGLLSFAQDHNGTFHLDENYKISPTGTIKLTTSDAKVYITGSSRSDAHVKIDREVTTRGVVFGREEFRVDVSEHAGDLEIREHANSTSVGMIGYHYEKYTVNIEVPEGNSLLIRGDDGDYQIKNVNGAISINVDDADVDLAGCKGNMFSFRVDDGDVTMDQGSGSLDIDADDADIRISNGHFDKILADLDDGDLVIATTLSDQGDYSIRSQDGLIDFTILGGGGQFDIRHDDGRVVADSGFEVVEKDENFSKIVLPHGSARVEIRADDARVRLAAR